jgi:LPS export ABC transporter protein LptC
MRPAARSTEGRDQRLIAAAAFVAGCALLYGLLGGRGADDLEMASAEDNRGYYLTDAILTEMGLDGRPRIVVHAKDIEQQLADQSVNMTDVQVDYAGAPTGLWKVTADRGAMTSDRTTMTLAGNVVVTGTEPDRSAVINTDELAYDTKANLVQTTKPVVVRFGGHELRGRGLRADLNAGTLRLESNVNGHFTP